MPGSEPDKFRDVGAAQSEIPLSWKLGACVAIVLFAITVAALLTIPLSCVLNDWPQPVCRMVQAVMP